MERADLPEVDFTDMDRGYESQGDLARDLFKWLDLILYRYYEPGQFPEKYAGNGGQPGGI